VNSSLAFDNRSGLEIAAIGMSGRFPGSGNLDEFWRNLRDGVDSIMSVELANRIAADFTISISAVDILDAQSVFATVSHLNTEIDNLRQEGSVLETKHEIHRPNSKKELSSNDNESPTQTDNDWEEGYI